MATATPRWSDMKWQPGKGASLAFDVVDAATPNEAAGASGVFQYNSTCPWDGYLWADPPSVTRPSFGLWLVTCNFVPGSGASKGDDPFRQPPKIKWRPGLTSEPFDRDVHGNTITNTIGETYDSPFNKDVQTLFLTITRNERSYDVTKQTTFGDTINSKDFTFEGHTIKEGQARCLTIAPTTEYDGLSLFVPVAYDFEVRKDGWRLRTMSQSRNGYAGEGSDAESGPLYTGKGEQVSESKPLTRTGLPVDKSLRVTLYKKQPTSGPWTRPKDVTFDKDSDDGTAFLLYDQYDEVDFAGLGL